MPSDLQEPGSDGQDTPTANISEAVAEYKQRLESLLDVYWPGAVSGEHKSAELCRRLIQQHAALSGVDGKSVPAPPMVKGVDELAKLRARRAE